MNHMSLSCFIGVPEPHNPAPLGVSRCSQVTHFRDGALIGRQLIQIRGRRQQTFEGALAFVQQPEGRWAPWASTR